MSPKKELKIKVVNSQDEKNIIDEPVAQPAELETKKVDTLLLETLDQMISIKEERNCQDQQDCKVEELFVPGLAPGNHYMLEPQEVIGPNVTNLRSALKLEQLEDTSLMETIDQIISIKQERICQFQQEDYHDSREIFVPDPALGSHCKSEPQEPIGTDVTSVRATVKLEPVAWIGISDDELISAGMLETCGDKSYYSDHNSSQSHHGSIDSQKVGLACWKLNILGETTKTTTRDKAQGMDSGVTMLEVEDVKEKRHEAFSADTQHKNPVSFVDGKQSLQCDLCKRLFRLKRTLRIHIRAHIGNNPYKCWVCNKQFTRSFNLARHCRIHTGSKPYRCQVCAKEFSQSPDLTRHSRIHSGSKPYQCEVCCRGFSQSSTLTRHSRIHLGLKPYKCLVCHKQFRRCSSLTTHSKIH